MKRFGFGAMRLPLKDANDKTSIDLETMKQMVDIFMEAGFTYFDTAYLYHDEMSEPALKKALVERYPRESFVLADKMPTVIVKSADDYERFFANQLERTGAGYFDYYLMHNMCNERYAKTKQFGGFEFAMQKKAEGKIKKFGFSFHDDAETLDRILNEHPEVDFVQLQINYLDWDNNVIQSRKCYEVATRHNKPVVVMEPVKGGMLANLPESAAALFKAHDETASPASYALRFAASHENVMMVLSGMSSIEQVLDNTRTMADMKPLSEEEKLLLQNVTQKLNESIAIPCTACGYCREVCPKNIAIPALFGLYNNYKTTGNFSSMYYNRAVYEKGKASDCIGCHLCEKNCPQHIQIPEELKKILPFEK